jgi:predicted solute-binding protein
VTRVVRLGAVSYLNTRPLVYGLAEPHPAPSTLHSAPALSTQHPAPSTSTSFDLRFDVPAVCAELLANGAIDLGLVPSITYAAGHRAVPGVSIASEGPVASVALYTRKPIREIRTLALDTSSRTSVALTRILCRTRFEIAPAFVPHAPDLAAMLAACDAALLIGDPALFVDHRALGAEKIDLGATWTDLTDLPFVWAFWVGRDGAPVTPEVVERLQAARDAGVSHSDAVGDAYAPGDVGRQTVARRYLRDNIQYGLTDRMLEGLRLYYREAAASGLIAAAPDLTFF